MPNRIPTFFPLPLPLNPVHTVIHERRNKVVTRCSYKTLEAPREWPNLRKSREGRELNDHSARFPQFFILAKLSDRFFRPPYHRVLHPFPLPPRMNLTVSLRGSASLSAAIFRPFNHSPLLARVSRLCPTTSEKQGKSSFAVQSPIRARCCCLRRLLASPPTRFKARKS